MSDRKGHSEVTARTALNRALVSASISQTARIGALCSLDRAPNK
jgi:hypothetical protein